MKKEDVTSETNSASETKRYQIQRHYEVEDGLVISQLATVISKQRLCRDCLS